MTDPVDAALDVWFEYPHPDGTRSHTPGNRARMRRVLDAHDARVERLEAALKFYANEANWRSTIEHTPEFMLNGRPRRDAYRKEAPVLMDGGEEARAALEAAKEGKACPMPDDVCADCGYRCEE